RCGGDRVLGAAAPALEFVAPGGRPLREGGATPAGPRGRPLREDEATPAGDHGGHPPHAGPSVILNLLDRGRRRAGDRPKALGGGPLGRGGHRARRLIERFYIISIDDIEVT